MDGISVFVVIWMQKQNGPKKKNTFDFMLALPTSQSLSLMHFSFYLYCPGSEDMIGINKGARGS